MNPNQAKIILGDEATIASLVIAKNGNALQAALAVRDAMRTVPAVVTGMGDSLAKLVSNPLILVENGVFSPNPMGRWQNQNGVQELFETAAAFFTSTDNVGNMGRWVIGNIADVIENAGYGIEELMQGTELAYNTVITSKATFRFFRDKRYPMPFSHHKEICYAGTLTDAQKHQIAFYAADNGLSLSTTRQIIKAMQEQMRDRYPDGAHDEDPETPPAEISKPEDLHANITDTDREPEPKQFLIVSGGSIQFLHDRPTRAQVEEAEEVYEIRRIVKSGAGRTGPAEGTDGEVLPADEPDGTGGN